MPSRPNQKGLFANNPRSRWSALVPKGNGSMLSLLCLGCLWGSLAAPASAAVQAWERRYGTGTANYQARQVLADAHGDLIVAGYTGEGGSERQLVVLKYSAAGSLLWSNQCEGPPLTATNRPIALTADPAGRVFVGAAGQGDYLMVAYSAAGVGLWTNRYGSPGSLGSSYPAGIAVDSAGNVIVTGSSFGPRNAFDYATLKYSADGALLWVNRYSSIFSMYAKACGVAVDTNGDVFVSGFAWPKDLGGYDYLTLKYSSDGRLLWSQDYDGRNNGHDFARAMTLDASGNVIVTGSSDYGFTTLKYSSAGAVVWKQEGGGWQEPVAVATDPKGNVFVTGYGGSSGSYYYATVAYSSAGTVLWRQTYHGPGGGDDLAQALAVDAQGNVTVTGASHGSGSSLDYVTIKYSGAGVGLWTNRYNGSANGADQAVAVALGPGGAVYVTGASAGPSVAGTTFYDFLTLSYLEVSPVTLTATAKTDATFNLQFTNTPGATFSLLSATDASAPLDTWTVLGPVPEVSPGQFQFTGLEMTNSPQRFYRVRSP